MTCLNENHLDLSWIDLAILEFKNILSDNYECFHKYATANILESGKSCRRQVINIKSLPDLLIRGSCVLKVNRRMIISSQCL